MANSDGERSAMPDTAATISSGVKMAVGDGPVFPEAAPAAISWVREQLRALSPVQKMASGIFTLALVLVIAAATFGAPSEQGKRVLYSNLSDTDGAAIIAALQQLNIPYEFSEGGAAILVPQDKLYETRLTLAGQGLPKAANVGFEILDSQQFGTSQFVEQINYVRGLEGELARSISSLDQIKNARVHLAIPKQTAFVRKQEAPTASVVVEMFPGRMLSPEQSFAITRLVSTAVPRLTPENVSVLDTEGAMLAPVFDRGENLAETQLAYSSELEAVLNRRVATILEPIAGADGYRAQVAVDIDFSERERTSEIFGKNADAAGQSKRSEKIIESSGADRVVGGIPGALTNQPIAPPEAPIVNEYGPMADESGFSDRDLVAPGPIETDDGVIQQDAGRRREQITNFEVDRVIESIKDGKGDVRRISVAVVLDLKTVPGPAGSGASQKQPFSDEELAEVRSLVQDAVGFDESRGDRVSVVNIAFWEQPAPPPPPVISEGEINNFLRYALFAAAALLLVLIAYFAAVRPIRARLKQNQMIETNSPEFPDVLVETSDEPVVEAENDEASPDPEENNPMEEDPAIIAAREKEEQELRKQKIYEELVEFANSFASENPQKASLVLQSWLAQVEDVKQQDRGLSREEDR